VCEDLPRGAEVGLSQHGQMGYSKSDGHVFNTRYETDIKTACHLFKRLASVALAKDTDARGGLATATAIYVPAYINIIV
jgi:hypothetical protein